MKAPGLVALGVRHPQALISSEDGWLIAFLLLVQDLSFTAVGCGGRLLFLPPGLLYHLFSGSSGRFLWKCFTVLQWLPSRIPLMLLVLSVSGARAFQRSFAVFSALGASRFQPEAMLWSHLRLEWENCFQAQEDVEQ